MDIALQNALSAKQRIKAEIAALEDRARQIDAFIALYGEFAQGNTPVAIPPLPALPVVPLPPSKRPSIPDVVAQILSDGYPRTTAVLLNMLAGQGIHIGGDKKIVNLSSTLSRDPRFANDRIKGWSLAGLPKPASPSSVGAEEGLFK